MSTTTLNRHVRPVVTEAAAHAVATAVERLGNVFSALTTVGMLPAPAVRAALQRRLEAQRVLEMARRYDASQPGFASDLRVAAYRAMDADEI